MAKIEIDGKEYDTDNLSEDARNKLANVTYCDRKLNELRREGAVIQTARALYARELREALEKEAENS